MFYHENEKLRFHRIMLQKEGDLNRIYSETNGNLAPFLNLYKMAKIAGYSVGHVICLLGVADNGLPELEHRYNIPKLEVNWLEAKNPCGICRKFLTIIIERYYITLSSGWVYFWPSPPPIQYQYNDSCHQDNNSNNT